MNLTEQEQQAIEHGKAVPVLVGRTECVVIRRDVFDRVRSVIDEDDPRQMYPAVLRAWDSVGSPDDAMLYQDVEPEA